MSEENEVVVPAETVEVVEPVEEATPEVPETTEETPEELKARLAKAEELANNYKVRAEKAEKKNKETAAAPKEPQSSMSLADSHALLKADVHEDDIDRVQKFATAEGISIREALKSDELKAILSVRSEKRSTAAAANVSNVRRGPAKVADDVLLSNAEKGKLPDSDEDIERLIAAKAKQK